MNAQFQMMWDETERFRQAQQAAYEQRITAMRLRVKALIKTEHQSLDHAYDRDQQHYLQTMGSASTLPGADGDGKNSVGDNDSPDNKHGFLVVSAAKQVPKAFKETRDIMSNPALGMFSKMTGIISVLGLFKDAIMDAKDSIIALSRQVLTLEDILKLADNISQTGQETDNYGLDMTSYNQYKKAFQGDGAKAAEVDQFIKKMVDLNFKINMHPDQIDNESRIALEGLKQYNPDLMKQNYITTDSHGQTVERRVDALTRIKMINQAGSKAYQELQILRHEAEKSHYVDDIKKIDEQQEVLLRDLYRLSYGYSWAAAALRDLDLQKKVNAQYTNSLMETKERPKADSTVEASNQFALNTQAVQVMALGKVAPKYNATVTVADNKLNANRDKLASMMQEGIVIDSLDSLLKQVNPFLNALVTHHVINTVGQGSQYSIGPAGVPVYPLETKSYQSRATNAKINLNTFPLKKGQTITSLPFNKNNDIINTDRQNIATKHLSYTNVNHFKIGITSSSDHPLAQAQAFAGHINQHTGEWMRRQKNNLNDWLPNIITTGK